MKLSRKSTQFKIAASNEERRELLVACLWLLSGLVILLVYYQQIWQLLRIGPLQWIRENYSLEIAIRPFWNILHREGWNFSPPAFLKSMARVMHAFWGAGVVLCAAQGYGAFFLRAVRIQLNDWKDALLFRTALGLGIISYLSLGLALIHRYNPVAVQFLLIPPGLGFVIWLLIRFDILRRSPRIFLLKAHRKMLAVQGQQIWMAIFLTASLIALIAALAPETEYDALWYHLWLPKIWLLHGQPVDVVNEYISLYPLTWELDYGAAMVLGGPVAAKLVHWFCLPLTSLLVFQLTRKFFARVSVGPAVALFVCIPTVMWEATTAYNDLALAFYSCLAVYALLLFLKEDRLQWLVLGSACLGLSLAIKHLALFVFLLAVCGVSFSLWQKTKNLARMVSPVLLMVVISLLIPLPWYLRSWQASGNPFFPDLYRLFGAFPPDRWSEVTEQGLANFKAHFGDPRTPLNLLLLPWNMTVHSARYGGSLGPVFLMLLPGLITRKISQPVGLLLAFVTGYIALWASPLSSFQLRFLVPITPLLGVLGAIAFDRLTCLLTRINFQPTYGRMILAGLLLLNLPPFLSLHETDRQGDRGWLTHVIHSVPSGVLFGFETEENYLTRFVPSYQAWKYINRQLPAQAVILTFSGGDQLYSERQRIWSDATIARPATWGAQKGEEQDAISYLRRLGVTHILVDRVVARQQAEASGIAILQPDVLERDFRLVYRDPHFALYQLH